MGQTAKELAALLVRYWEQYREFAYPDPASELYKAAPGKRWGRMPAVDILEELPTSIASLKATPWTVGYGETGPHIGPMTRWSLASAETSLQVRLDEYQAGVRRLAKRPMRAWEEAALISFAWNVGLDEDEDTIAEGLGDSTLLRLFNAGSRDAAAEQFLVWIKAGGRKMAGLRARRIQERSMFMGTHPAIQRV